MRNDNGSLHGDINLIGGSSDRYNYKHTHYFDNTLQFMNVFSRPLGPVCATQPFGSIRNPNRRSSIDSKYALDARAVSRLSFERLWCELLGHSIVVGKSVERQS